MIQCTFSFILFLKYNKYFNYSIRRALERFNTQMQNSFMQTSQYPANTNGLPRQLSNGYQRQGSFDPYYPADPQQNDPWGNFNRLTPAPPAPAPASTSITSTGYQSIIGRRRQMRQDDMYHDTSTVGNGYSTPAFMTNSHPYSALNNPYMHYADEPPAVPPRLHRDLFREQQEYLCENVNNNNNNNIPYLQQAYPTAPNGFRPINHSYVPLDSFHQLQDEEYLRHRAQSTSSTTSSDSVHPIRLNKQQLPPTSTRTNVPSHKKIPSDNSQEPSGKQ